MTACYFRGVGLMEIEHDNIDHLPVLTKSALRS
jgi:hypothetical protein